jgi:hypothetical protein
VRDEQVRVEPAAGVDQVRPPVDGVVVEGLHQRPRLTVDVGALDDQAQRLTRPEAGARRQDLDVERDDLTAPGLELPLVGEDGLAGVDRPSSSSRWEARIQPSATGPSENTA